MTARIGTILVWGLLLALIPLSAVIGSIASILASALAILLIPFAVARKGWLLVRREPAMLIFLAVFLALAVCFVLTARTPRDPLFAFNFIALPLAAAVYVVAARSDRGSDAVLTISILCLTGALAALLVAVNDIYLRHLGYVYGFNLGPHVIARVALTLGFVALAGLFATRSRWRFALYAAPLAAVIVVYLSGTRGAFPALPVMALVLAGCLAADRRDHPQLWVLIGLGVLGLAALALSSNRIASIIRIVGELFAGSTSDASANERLAMLGAAWQLFLASPVVGYGWANFAAVAHPLIGTIVWGGPTDPFFQFHNDLANFAVAAGGIGVVCWGALLAAPVVGALAAPRDALFRVRLYCCLQLSAGYAVFGLTDMTLGYDLPTTLYAFLTAIVLGAFREPQQVPLGAAPAMRMAA